MKSKLISREKKKNTLDESFECDSLTMYLNENITLVLAAPWSKSPEGRHSTSLSLSLAVLPAAPWSKSPLGRRGVCVSSGCVEKSTPGMRRLPCRIALLALTLTFARKPKIGFRIGLRIALAVRR